MDNPAPDIFGELKDIRMTPEERNSMLNSMQRMIQQDNAVREGSTERLDTTMEHTSSLLTGIGDRSSLILSEEEKFAMLRALKTQIHHLPKKGKRGIAKQIGDALASLMRKPVLASILAVVVAVSGVTQAEAALPGDILYPVKRLINEPIIASIQLTAQTRASWNIERAGRRLEEAEALAARAALDATVSKDIAANFQSSAEAAAAEIANLRAAGETAKAIAASIELQSSLEAHAAVLRRLAENDEAIKPTLVPLLASVESGAVRSITLARETSAAVTSKADAKENLRVANAEGLRSAKKTLMNARSFLASQKANDQNLDEAELDITAAESSLVDAQARVDAGDDVPAVALVGGTLKDAKQARLMLQINAHGHTEWKKAKNNKGSDTSSHSDRSRSSSDSSPSPELPTDTIKDDESKPLDSGTAPLPVTLPEGILQ